MKRARFERTYDVTDARVFYFLCIRAVDMGLRIIIRMFPRLGKRRSRCGGGLLATTRRGRRAPGTPTWTKRGIGYRIRCRI